jgi:hypothetical protein
VQKIIIMEENQNQVEGNYNKKKKKFVYLEKYELFKEETDEKIQSIQKSINISYIVIAALVLAVTIALLK